MLKGKPLITNILIRPAAENDALVLWQIIQNAFEEYRGKLTPPSGIFTEMVDDIREKVTEGGGFLAFTNNQTAGGVVYQPKADYIYLGRLAVLPEFRGQGISKALVEAVENRAVELNLPRVQVGVWVVLPRNQAMFEHLGYQISSYEAHPGFTEPTFLIYG